MTTTPMPELNEAQERAAFEATEQGSDLARLWGAPELYANPCVENRWQGWLKARRASSAQQVDAGSSIDTPEFRKLVRAVWNRAGMSATGSADSPYKTFKPGNLVHKTKGAQWKGRVVGFYSTTLTPEGYAVESSTEKGSVQIYPVAALALYKEAGDA